MKDKINHLELRATATYKKNMTEATKGLGQRIDKGSTNYYFVFGGFFTQRGQVNLQRVLFLTLLVL